MKETYVVKVLPMGMTLRVPKGRLLADALTEAGIPMNLSCGRNGICGKCRIDILSGKIPPGDEGGTEGMKQKASSSPPRRLACRLRVQSDLSVRIPRQSILKKIRVLDSGEPAAVIPDPSVKGISFIPDSSLKNSPVSLGAVLEKGFGKPLIFSSSAVRNLHRTDRNFEGSMHIVLREGREIIDVERETPSSGVFGVALDIGTTTLVADLIDLSSGASRARLSGVNAQVSYGADVVSRIAAASENPYTRRDLSSILRRQIAEMIRDLARTADISPDRIYEVVVAGNTVMNHLLLDVPVETLGTAPFRGLFTEVSPVPAADLDFQIHPAAEVIIVPNIAGFVGGDIAAGLAALDFPNRAGRCLFVDIGTNGELVLKNGTRMTATSTAAGPAFEGGATSCGMLALPGAIRSVRWKNSGFEIRTIGNLPPRGICGSGLVDILAVALRRGLLTRGGKIESSSRVLRVAGKISLNQTDIRLIQLAVAAFKSGLRILLESERLAPDELDSVFVGGAFGSSLDIRNAMSLGLLPMIDPGKIVFVGNSSLAGARKILLRADERKTLAATVRKVGFFSLAEDPEFQNKFIEALTWGPVNGDF